MSDLSIRLRNYYAERKLPTWGEIHDAADEIDRLQEAKRAALKLDGERAKEANELRQDRDKWHRVAMEAGAVTCVDGSHIFPLKQGK